MTTEQLQRIWPEWEIMKALGKGAFGTVYEIRRALFEKEQRAALKVIHIPQNDTEIRQAKSEGMDDQSLRSYFYGFVQSLSDEIDLLSRLQGHSNIVSYQDHAVIPDDAAEVSANASDTVYLNSDDSRKTQRLFDASEAVPSAFGWTVMIRMELLTPLDVYMQRHPMGHDDVVRLGQDICKALTFCEENHIIHRDIKPENVFVTQNGNFKLGDFGVAREMEKSQAGLSRKGTASYMAPEVFNGLNYNHTADIYSLGILLYRCLNGGRTPFLPSAPAPITATDRETALQKSLSGVHKPPIPNTPDWLSVVVQKMCAAKPKDRYQSASEAMQALSSDGKGNKSLKTKQEYRTAGKITPKKAGIIGAVSVVLVVLIILAAIFIPKAIQKNQYKISYSAAQLQAINNATLVDFTFGIAGHVYTFPIPLQQLYDDGFVLTESSQKITLNTKMGISPVDFQVTYFQYGKLIFPFYLYSEDKDADTNNIQVMGTCVFPESIPEDAEFRLPGLSITTEINATDLLEKYGQPSEHKKSGDEGENIAYRYTNGNVVEFSFRDNVLWVLEISKCKPMGESNDQIEQVFSKFGKYQAPNSLGDDIGSGNIQLFGKIYRFPMPLSELVKNGVIVITDIPDTLLATDKYETKLRMGSDIFIVDVENPFDEEKSFDECYITAISSEPMDHEYMGSDKWSPIENESGINPGNLILPSNIAVGANMSEIKSRLGNKIVLESNYSRTSQYTLSKTIECSFYLTIEVTEDDYYEDRQIPAGSICRIRLWAPIY